MIRPIGRFLMLSSIVTSTMAQSQPGLGAEDRTAIQALVTSYARALGNCRAEEFADLFVPETGYFASGFRGHIVGHEKLVELVESERHCLVPADERPARPGGANGPTVELETDAGVVRGVADLGTAEYQDEYVKTADGWRFAARTVIIEAEKAAGLDAGDLLAISKLGGDELGDRYVTEDNGVTRFLTAGIAVNVVDGEVTGRAYLEDGGYRDEVYEQLASGEWRVKSSTYVPQ